MIDSKALAEKIAGILDKKGATDIQILEVGHMTSITDFFVVASGRNVQSVHTLAEDVEDHLAECTSSIPRSASITTSSGSGRTARTRNTLKAGNDPGARL